MSTPDLVTSAEAAEILGVDHSTISRWSDDRLDESERKLTPAMRLPTRGNGRVGAKLFARADVEALRDQLTQERAS